MKQATYQSALWLDKWPVLSIHLVVETAGVAEVVAVAVPSPQRGGGGATINTLPAFWKILFFIFDVSLLIICVSFREEKLIR